MPGLYAWLRRRPRLVDGALALLLIYPGAGIPKLGILRVLISLPFVLGMAIPVVFRRAYPVRAFTAVIAFGPPAGPRAPPWSPRWRKTDRRSRASTPG